MPQIHNYHFKIIENEETKKLIFLRQLVDGGTDKSYGIHVAMMAGLLPRVIDRSFDLVNQVMASAQNNTIPASQRILEIDPTTTQSDLSTLKKPSERKSPKKSVQMSLFPTVKVDDSELIIMLRSLDFRKLNAIAGF